MGWLYSLVLTTSKGCHGQDFRDATPPGGRRATFQLWGGNILMGGGRGELLSANAFNPTERPGPALGIQEGAGNSGSFLHR